MGATKVDFYTLGEPDRRARLVTACRLAEKAYEQGLRVAVRTASAAETAEFDELLWTFCRPQLRAARASGRPSRTWSAATPVLVGSASLPATHRDVLINLAPDAPADFSAYARICEVVGGDEDAKKAGRLRWRTYRDAGCAPEAHPL